METGRLNCQYNGINIPIKSMVYLYAPTVTINAKITKFVTFSCSACYRYPANHIIAIITPAYHVGERKKTTIHSSMIGP